MQNMRYANMRYTTHNTQLLLKTQDPRFSRILPGSSWVLTKSPVLVLWSSRFRRGRWVLNPAVPKYTLYKLIRMMIYL